MHGATISGVTRSFATGSVCLLFLTACLSDTATEVSDDEAQRALEPASSLLTANFGDTARFVGLPRNTAAKHFEYVVSCPTLIPGESYRGGERRRAIFMLHRDKSAAGYNVHLVQRSAELQTARLAGFPGWLNKWDPVRTPLIDPDQGVPVDHQGVAFKGALHATWGHLTFTDGVAQGKIGQLSIFDLRCLTSSTDDSSCLRRRLRVDEIPGYEGPPRGSVSLTRVTKDSLKNPDGKEQFFDPSQGRVVAAWNCHKRYWHRDDASRCPYGSGVFIQEYFYDEATGEPRLGRPIRIYQANIDAIPDVEQLLTRRLSDRMIGGRLLDGRGAKITNFFNQNVTVSAIGNDTFVLSFVYNSVLEHGARRVDRDFPTYTSFIKYRHVHGLLDRARKEPGLVDVSAEHRYADWRLRKASLERSGGPEDQAAVWSNQFFVHPELEGTAFSFYESWGGFHNQPPETKDRLYPGTATHFVRASASEAQGTAHAFCAGHKLYGGKCLSAELIGGPRHGQELSMTERRSEPLASLLSAHAAERVAVQCADIGSSDDAASDDLRILTATVTARRSETAAAFGDRVCRGAGHAGFVFMEWKTTPRAPQVGYQLDGRTLISHRRYTFLEGEVYTIGCSRRYGSGSFSMTVLEDDERCCEQVCDEAGAGPHGIGLRPYRSELFARNVAGASSVMTHVNAGHHMKKRHFERGWALWRDRWFASAGGSTVVRNTSPVGWFALRCVCGPGQSLDGKMVYRRFAYAWD